MNAQVVDMCGLLLFLGSLCFGAFSLCICLFDGQCVNAFYRLKLYLGNFFCVSCVVFLSPIKQAKE